MNFRNFISKEEETYIKFGLLSSTPKTVKKTLQRLCSYYESGRSLVDNYQIRHHIYGHLGSITTEVRRYALKALALIGSPLDAPRILDRLAVEKDIETQSWGTSALASMRGTQKERHLDRELGLDLSKTMTLSQMLYGRPNAADIDRVTISIDHDNELDLKWALFLVGYDRAPRKLFTSSNDHGSIAGELMQHDSDVVREYAAWALWERPEFNFAQSQISLEDSAAQPTSVRKWLYQLSLKSPESADLTPDLLEDLARDIDSSAREGLARGAAKLGNDFDKPLTDWLRREDDENVRLELLEGLTRNPTRSQGVTSLLIDVFRESKVDGPERQRLLVAASGSQLYLKFQQLGLPERHSFQTAELALSLPSSQLIIAETVLMTNDSSIHAGGNITAQTVNSGTMIASANGAVQTMNNERTDDKLILQGILDWLQTSKIAEEEKTKIANATEAVAKDPSPENKKSLFGKLKEVGEGIAKYGGAIGALANVLRLAQGWADAA